jgi:uncharacterized membrane protein
MHRATMIALVGAATVVGAVIRLAVTRGLSLDEIVTLDRAQRPLGQLITRLAHGGVHPPLHPVLEWSMLRLFGDGDFAARLPSLIAGVALVPAVAWLAVELFDRRTAVVAGLFASVSPLLVFYSQEASGYALVALFGTLAVIGAVRIAKRGTPGDFVLHAAAASLALWSDWSGVLIVAATEIALAAALVRRRRRGELPRRVLGLWALDTLALAWQLVALMVLFVSQLHSNGGLKGVTDVAASGVSFYSTVSNASWALFGFQPSAVSGVLSAVWPLAMLASLVMVGRGAGRRAWLLLICALVPAIAVFVLGLLAPGSFDVRYAIAAVPPILVLLARVATGWPRGRTGAVLVVGGMLALLTGALVDQQLNPDNPRRYDYGPALTQVQREAGPRSAVFYEPANLRAVVQRDAPGLHALPLTTHLPTRRRVGSVFVVTSFSNQPALLELRNREIGALRATRHLVRYRGYPGVRVWWFR